MHSVSPDFSRSSSAIRSSIRAPTGSTAATSRDGADAAGRQLLQLDADLLQRQPDPLGEDDEGDPPQDRARR